MGLKGATMSIQTILMIVVGILLILGVMNAWGSFQDGNDDTIQESQGQTDDKIEGGTCIYQCRINNPVGGGAYETCVSSNCP